MKWAAVVTPSLIPLVVLLVAVFWAGYERGYREGIEHALGALPDPDRERAP